ncbi:hypothetical protein CC80DRAFT_517923 [Byssothecium circinans]|uniref:N-acetyltransferase domain-containing protein n=1 Tax=Byssothecium circinans TaxID=147558 RepID=A0A6A5TNL0_9PLEO|nr:hypothetical protein CC80DRAFT_517923 [Byssothecium circinans]
MQLGVYYRTALLTPKVLLVPYSEHHVPTYHTWMQDPDLQALTASEPLTLPEEYAMQTSWRTDADKITFIVCTSPLPLPPTIIPPTKHDTPHTMIGDINLFLTPSSSSSPEDPDTETDWRLTDPSTQKLIQTDNLQPVVGEVEIMIAAKGFQGRGLGREVLLVFMWYVLYSQDAIMEEFQAGGEDGKGNGKGKGGKKCCLQYLRVKIDEGNVRSIKLFEGVGFKKVAEEANYFCELELRWPVSGKSLGEIEGRLESVPQRLAYELV